MDLKFNASQNGQEMGEAVYRDHLPQGRAWWFLSRFGGAMVASAGACWAYVKNYADYIKIEIDINTTVDAIEEHEESVGLPDACSIRASTIELRRGHVKIRLKKTPTVTAKQMEVMVKDLTGIDVKIMPRRSGGNFFNGLLDGMSNFDAAPFGSDLRDRFMLDVFIRYIDPCGFNENLPFDTGAFFDGTPRPEIIKCVIERLKPANTLAFYHFNNQFYNQVKDSS